MQNQSLKIELIKGYICGYRSPSLQISLSDNLLSKKEIDDLSHQFKIKLPNYSTGSTYSFNTDKLSEITQANVDFIWQISQELHSSISLSVSESPKILSVNPNYLQFLLPVNARAQKIVAEYIAWIAKNRNFICTSQDNQLFFEELDKCLSLLQKMAYKSSNNPHFLKAAYLNNVPTYELLGDSIQYGQGKRSRWLNSSFTQETSQLSANFARNKHHSAHLMRRAGIPVPEHHLASNENSATLIANKLGYPVVIKPADADGGFGVTAELMSDDEIGQAFKLASKYSKKVLVEKHVYGKDYRLIVMGDEVIWAIERVPGGVWGDGIHSISQLVNMLNQDPRRAARANAPLKPLVWDAEAETCLKRQKMTGDSIPSDRLFVRLRRAANIALGGQPIAVFEKIHPDNKILAIQATRALRLDLAGVDMLIPDIEKSWHTTGAAICEVNAQPNIGSTTSSHVYPQILNKIIPAGGRIPIVLILENSDTQSILKHLLKNLSKDYVVGAYHSNKIYKNHVLINQGIDKFYYAGELLVKDSEVDIMIMVISDSRLLQSGLPFDRYDLLIDVDPSPFDCAQFYEKFLPACQGKVLRLKKDDNLNFQSFDNDTVVIQDCSDINVLQFEAISAIRNTGLNTIALNDESRFSTRVK